MPSEQFHHWTAASVHVVRGTAVETDTPWHDHDHLVIGVVDQGVRVVELRNDRFEVRAGQGFVLSPHVAHRCLNSDSVDYRVLCLDAPASRMTRPGCALIISPDWRTVFDRTFALAVGGENTSVEALTALTVSIAGVIEPSTAVEPRAVRQARRDLLADLGDRKTLRSLANGVGMSPFHLQRLFARVTGLSPRQQQMLARLRQVRVLLLEGMALNEIAVTCGFTDQSHLNRGFKRLMGISPGRYRSQVRAHDRNTVDGTVPPDGATRFCPHKVA